MDTSALEVFTFEGSPRTRGLQHGETLRARIHALLERWGGALERGYGLSRDRYVERFCAETKFLQALSRHAPHVLEEVRAIAEGAAIPFETLLAFQHVNEEFWLFVPPQQAPRGEACSTIALGPARGQPAMIGQNLDLDSYLDGDQIMLRYNCDRPPGRILAVSVPGMISLNGMNSHSIGICDNALTQLRGDIAGVPVFAIYRLLLECRALEEAVALVQSIPQASGLNWVMGGPSAVVMIERSAGRAVRYGPDDPSVPIYHTNHPLKNDELASRLAKKPGRSTYLRQAALHERISALKETLSIPDIKAILSSRDDSDYPVSRDGGANAAGEQTGFTFASCIFELDAVRPRLHVAAGPPHRCEYRTFDV